ncbi:hypothetical protein C8R47DRAFT_1230917 [Mycena vitilis]|nr:hypothetical protein C8R47DRAFT_1230917 [Mycena vitilis]
MNTSRSRPPISAATSFLFSLASNRTTTTFMPILGFSNEVLRSNAPAPQRFGALNMTAALGPWIMRHPDLSSGMEQSLLQFVKPEFGSAEGYVRAIVCLRYILTATFSSPENLNVHLCAVSAALDDPEFPVRVQAALALMEMVLVYDEVKTAVSPQVSKVNRDLLKMSDETDLDILNKSMEVMVEAFQTELMPVAAHLTARLCGSYLRLINESSVADETELENQSLEAIMTGDDDKPYTAMGVVMTLGTLPPLGNFVSCVSDIMKMRLDFTSTPKRPLTIRLTVIVTTIASRLDKAETLANLKVLVNTYNPGPVGGPASGEPTHAACHLQHGDNKGERLKLAANKDMLRLSGNSAFNGLLDDHQQLLQAISILRKEYNELVNVSNKAFSQTSSHFLQAKVKYPPFPGTAWYKHPYEKTPVFNDGRQAAASVSRPPVFGPPALPPPGAPSLPAGATGAVSRYRTTGAVRTSAATRSIARRSAAPGTRGNAPETEGKTEEAGGGHAITRTRGRRPRTRPRSPSPAMVLRPLAVAPRPLLSAPPRRLLSLLALGKDATPSCLTTMLISGNGSVDPAPAPRHADLLNRDNPMVAGPLCPGSRAAEGFSGGNRDILDLSAESRVYPPAPAQLHAALLKGAGPMAYEARRPVG